MPSQTTPEFSQPKNYEALAEKYGVKPNDYKQIRDEIKGFSFTVLTTDKLGLSKRLLDFYANDKKNSIPVAQKKMLAMLAQLTKASQSIPGFDVETIKTGEKFTFEGNTVKIEHPTGTFQETTDPSDATKSISTEIVEIFTLNLAGDRPHIIDEHRQALEGTKVATANEWIDRNILSGVALAGAGIKNWEKDRDKFTEAILAAPRNAQAETKMPTTELANELTTIQEMSKEEGGGKYSAKYNLAILDFLRKTRDNNQNMGMYWANVQAYLTGHQDLMKEREETKLEIPTTPLIATSEPFLKATPSPLLAPSELKPAPTETQAANFPEVVSGAGLDLETPTAVINDPALTPAEQAMNGNPVVANNAEQAPQPEPLEAAAQEVVPLPENNPVVAGAGLELETPPTVVNDPALTPAEQAMNGNPVVANNAEQTPQPEPPKAAAQEVVPLPENKPVIAGAGLELTDPPINSISANGVQANDVTSHPQTSLPPIDASEKPPINPTASNNTAPQTPSENTTASPEQIIQNNITTLNQQFPELQLSYHHPGWELQGGNIFANIEFHLGTQVYNHLVISTPQARLTNPDDFKVLTIQHIEKAIADYASCTSDTLPPTTLNTEYQNHPEFTLYLIKNGLPLGGKIKINMVDTDQVYSPEGNNILTISWENSSGEQTITMPNERSIQSALVNFVSQDKAKL